MKLVAAAVIVALTLPVLSLADVIRTTTLMANMSLNLDAGSSGTSSGDLLWDGSMLTPQGSARAAVLQVSGSMAYDGLNSVTLSQLLASIMPTNAPISSPAVNSIIAVHTNGGNNAKLLVTSNSGGSLGLQYTTFGATAPNITDVQNAASNTPSALPNGPIAQGALFVVKGSNLGPATFIQQSSFPFTTEIGGTSIQVTVNGATVDVIMLYSSAAQVAGILPSKTPTGTGTLQLSYNGGSATAPITVMPNNLGIYTVSTSGSGDAIAFLNSDSQLITPTHAANAGDVIAIWGTGLGPVNLDETMSVSTATGGNQAVNAPLQVYIGGKPASIGFQGRNGCCTSVDSIYVTVPDGVSGCAVSVLMQIGNMVSNATSIAVADNGRTCTPVHSNVPVGFTGSTYKYGGLFLARLPENIVSPSTESDFAEISFDKITLPDTPPTGSQLDINSYGSCSSVINPLLNNGSITYLDAGPSISAMGPGSFGTKTIPIFTHGGPYYSAQLDQTATTLVPGAYTFTGPGGPDVGAFSANYTLPPIFRWTDSITSVTRASGVTVHWTGGNPSGYVSIRGTSSTSGISVSFTCTAHVSDGSFNVPSVVLLALPPSGSSGGSLSVETFDYQTVTPPSGLDAAQVGSYFLYGNSVTYQ